jgi:hypothetical protein
VNVYNTACLTNAVTFTLTDVAYTTNETFPIIIAENSAASAVNTLTIQPASNTNVLIKGSSASAVIKLNGADYVTINGIHDIAGTNLTIENSSNAAGTAVVWLASVGAGQGATNNTIKNVTLKGGADQKSTSTITYGIVIAGSTLTTTITTITAGADNDNNTIDTCTLSKVRYGIYIRGGSTANPNQGNVISRNVIGATGFGVDEIGKAGVVVREEDGIQIINNEIRYVGGDLSNITASSVRAGIALSNDATWLPTSVYVKNAVVRSNIIHDIQDEKAGAAIGIIVSGADGTNATNNIIANNFIFSIKANGTSSPNQAVGIGIAAGNGDKVVYNSVFLSGSTNASTGATTPTVSSFGIRVAVASATNLSVLNNIVYMNLSSSPASSLKNFCIDIPTGYTWGTGNMNNNDWYINLSNPQALTGSINNGASASATLALWQVATSKDANSKEGDPQFSSISAPIDLHLQPSSPMDGQAVVMAGVTTDIDNQIRSNSTPDIGADELPAATGLDIKPQALVSPAISVHGCYSVEQFVVSIKNNGSFINFFSSPVTVTVTVSGAVPVPIVRTVTLNSGTLAAAGVLNVTMDATGIDMNLQPGVYVFNITTSVAGDVNTANDALQEIRTEESLTYGTTFVTPTDYCNTGGKPVLTATGSNGYSSLQWQQSTTSGSGFTDIPGATGLTFTMPSNITQTTFYKLLAFCSSYTDESGESAVVLNNPQPLTTIPATRCGIGPVTLGATAPPGNTISWYSTMTGGIALSTGTNYSLPSLSSTTTYYVGIAGGTNVSNVGLSPTATTCGTIAATSGSDWALRFNTNAPLTLVSAYVIPTVAGTFTVALRNALQNTNLQTASFTFTAGDVGIPKKIILNFTIAVAGNYQITNTTTGGVYRIASYTCGYPMNSPSGNFSIVGSAVTSTTATITNIYNSFYQLEISEACEGTRVPVTATVTAAPGLTLPADKTICNNAVHSLQANTTSPGDFDSYVWTPATNLYTDAATSNAYVAGTSATQVYVRSSINSTVTYTLSATNNTTGCVNAATSAVTILPASTVSASPNVICLSGTSVLSVAPPTGYGNALLQWQSSPDGVAPYSDISAATSNSYTTPAITQNAYYKLIIRDGAGTTCSALLQPVIVTNPQVTGTTPASRCGAGTVRLAATGTSLHWYTNSTGGSAIGSGTSFTTPVIGSTTTYYVSAGGSGSSGSVGLPVVISTNSPSSGTTNFGLVFDALSAFTLNTVTVYPVSATITSGTVTIEVINAAGVVVNTATVNVTGYPSGNPVPQIATVNFHIQPGTNYKLRSGSFTGITQLLSEPSAAAPAGNYGYPFVIPGVVSINASTVTAAPANTPRTDLYYYFYNWQVTADCEGVRTPVVATVNTTSSNAAGAIGANECATKTINGATEFNYTDCDLISTITGTGVSPLGGNVNACVKIDNAVQTAPGGEPYVQRHYDIVPASNAATATSTITLYFLQTEFNAFNIAKGFYAALPTSAADVTGIAQLRITQYNGVGNAPGNYTGNAVQIDPNDADIIWNSTLSRWEVTFDATGSGGFYVHTGAFVLPVTITNFRGEQAGSVNKLFWNTSTETNNKGFELERSADGVSFSNTSFVASLANGGNSTAALNYNYDDIKPMSGSNYYRLKQIDNDGKFSYSNVVLLTRKVTQITLTGVYPNPTTRELNIKITSPRAEKLTLVVTDLTGKLLMQQPMNVVIGDNQQQINVAALAAGTYVLKAICINGCETAIHRFVKR